MALTDNLQAFYKLSDLSDSSGNNRTLTNNGNVSFASGKLGNAAVFDGSNYLSGTGNIVLNSSARIRLLVDPVDQQDAATKEYVDAIVETRPILLSLDLSDGQTNVYIINNILNVMAPPGADYRDGMYARILCSVLSNSTTLLDINPLVSAGTSTATFNTPTGTAPAVTNISVGPATVAAAPLSVIRFIKTFRIIVGVWQHQSDSTTF